MGIVRALKSLYYNTTMSANSYKMVLIVRTDIAMGKGKTAAQCAHAAIECYRLAKSNKSNLKSFDAWLHLGQPKVVLRVSSEQELLDIAQKTKNAGLVTSLIRDAGKTQLIPGTMTAMGIGPAPVDEIDKITGTLKLL